MITFGEWCWGTSFYHIGSHYGFLFSGVQLHFTIDLKNMTNTYTSIDQLPITLYAEDVAQVLGIFRAGAYTLMHSKGFPTIQIGKRMVVPKDKLLAWMEGQSAA